MPQFHDVWWKLKPFIKIPMFLYYQRIIGFTPPSDEPLMDPEGVVRFRQELGRSSSYVEFGSGGTTVLADRAGIPTVSVESDAYYARTVATRLSSGCIKQVVVDLGITGEWGFPLFSTADKGVRYISAPWGEQFPDFVLVDGRYRAACALESARRAYEAGADAVLMFDDYGTRPHYHHVENALGKPEMAGRAAIFRIGSRPVPLAIVERSINDKR